MDWLESLLWDPASVAHIVCLYAFVISVGVLLGKIKIFGISLGVTFVLFTGILMGHFGFTGETHILHFIREFGLILFVFCIGLQVGPSFFSSFKKGGMTLNMLAVGIVVLNIAVALGIYFIDGGIDLPMMVGILYGAVTNTPGLGAAQEALNQLSYTGDPIALGYACAYPLGVVGIIGSIIAVRYICRVNLKKEEDELAVQTSDMKHMPHMLHLEVRNESIDGKKLIQIKEFMGRPFVCSRIRHEGHVSIPNQDTEFHIGDQVFIVCSEEDAEAVTAFIGKEIQVDWEKQDMPMVSRRILVTKSEINGKKLGSLHFRSMYGVNVTRINRSGMDLFADPNLILQVGDRVMVVGQQDAVERVAGVLGNQLKRLDTPNIVTIFVGIFLGILLGSLPIAFPGIPTPVKLGLAGGPLVVAILIGRFGHKLKLVTYTTMSANLMLREIGIVLFLASVGIEAGAHFVETVVEGSGLLYVGYGFLITVIPLLIIGMIARFYCKVNYFTLMGLIAGSNTDPPALAYANQASGNDAPAVGYSTVYPLTMFLRILAGQMILLTMM
ncbi:MULTISPECIES: putative transporter [Bacteroides]|jgi:putative transport protein|uniref:Transporter n=2 Tax=Bacteroides intestinalis TaxID=329854 RepID=A0A3E4KZ27_9BACE|nr:MULTISPECIES: putative transporter [Bacteroides]CCY83356.1 trkA C-terminal domain protein [Bacteroides intestinalis CAG:564]QDO67422.1 putative transporter [Bacteroides intestinalis]RGK26150.1 putative transporter [Bacteroides intestinalis]RGT47568.1 putative transporter [Bacteroides intestinalis]RGX86335.1 putative transporter [Bacteroides intestinalis]